MSSIWLLLSAAATITGTSFSGRARVIDGDTLAIAGTSIRLFGIDAPESRQMCRQAGAQIACGQAAIRAIRQFIGGQPVRCLSTERDRYERPVATCTVSGRDLNEAMVLSGWAVAFTRYSDRYARQQAIAQTQRRGLWATEFQDPSVYRQAQRAARPAPSPAPNPACAIKGNINANGDRIFHKPGDRGYEEVRIDVGSGERWFCSSEQALAAGWRPRR